MTEDLGRLKIDVLSDGEFRLDGGAMFGMVPKDRWSVWLPPDEHNRIRLQTHGLLVRGPDYLLVVEPGLGETVDRDAFAVVKDTTLEKSLAAHGFGLDDVTHVTYTHLHFDHAGGGDKFPNATYLVQQREWETMNHPSVLHNRSYRAEDRPPEDRLVLIDGEREILPGVIARPAPGHTPGHQVFVLEDTAIFWGDHFPTQYHLSPARCMAYDLEPLRVTESKIALLAESSEKDWLNFLYHDLDPRPGKIADDRGRFGFHRD